MFKIIEWCMPQAVRINDRRLATWKVKGSQLLTIDHVTSGLLCFDQQHFQLFQSQASSVVDLIDAQFKMFKLLKTVHVSLENERAACLQLLLKGQPLQMPESVPESRWQDHLWACCERFWVIGRLIHVKQIALVGQGINKHIQSSSLGFNEFHLACQILTSQFQVNQVSVWHKGGDEIHQFEWQVDQHFFMIFLLFGTLWVLYDFVDIKVLLFAWNFHDKTQGIEVLSIYR